ncbi:MAG: hypothetical protein Kow001_20370 [Acidobacteriota bacterium]
MRRLIVLALVFAALGAFVYFYEIAGKEARDQAKEREESVLQLERDAVTALSISFEGKEKVRLEKQDGTWMLREPLETPADTGSVDSLLRSLTTAKRDRVFEGEGLDLKAYGLEAPTGTIEVTAGDQKKVLQLGNKDFSGSKVYVKLADSPSVLLTSTSLLTAADKPVLDWRSKNALIFDRTKVEEMEIRRDGSQIRLAKRDGTWRLLAPLEDLADENTISTLLSTIEFARAKEFVAEDPTSVKEFGLEQPSVSLRLRETGSDVWHQLDLGQPKGEDAYYARNPQRKPVFTLSKDVFADLTKDLWAFRQKDLVDLRQDQIKTLSYRHGETQFTVSQKDYRWTLESPEELKGKEALSYKFWYPIDDLEFTGIVQRDPLPEPEVEIEIAAQDDTRHVYRFAHAGDEYLAWKGDGSRVGTISRENFEKILLKPADLLENPPSATPESSAPAENSPQSGP